MVGETRHRGALPADHVVDGFRLRRVLGVGGFGITYLAEDRLERLVAVKEYFPTELAVREGFTVQVKSDKESEYFTWGRDRFLDEAKTLARFEHPNIIRVLHYMEANNTAYFVMAYEPGPSLRDHLLELGRLPTEYELRSLVMPLLSGLDVVHDAAILHRDIKPSNILIRPDLSPVLIDFGAARLALGLKERSLTTVVTPGYSPVEQYHRHGDQGPWTDFYALGAVLYRAITGQTPVEATQRVETVFSREDADPLPPLGGMALPSYSPHFLAAIDWALSLKALDRPQSVAEWRARFTPPATPAAQAGREDSNAHTMLWEPTEMAAEAKPLPAWSRRPALGAATAPIPSAEAATPPPVSHFRPQPWMLILALVSLLGMAGLAYLPLAPTPVSVKAPPPVVVTLEELAIARPYTTPPPAPTAPPPSPVQSSLPPHPPPDVRFAPPPEPSPIPFPPSSPQVDLQPCDFMAAAPGQGFGDGVAFEHLETRDAITACTLAATRYPEVARFETWLGRTYRKAGRDSDAFFHFGRAAERGDVTAQFNTGYLLQTGRGAPKDEAAAVRWYRKAADQGNEMAANNLGVLLKRGQSVVRNEVEAVHWFRKAADRGLADAENNLGLMLAEGRGTARDEAEAVRWYRMAAEQGFSDASNNLGFMLEHGRGVARDEAEALRWYRTAAEAGSAVAQNNLGLMLADGRGAPRAEAEAVHWFQMAAAQSLAAAENNLALMLQNGRGTARDEAQAQNWYRKAAAQGFEPARQALKRLGVGP